MKNKLTAISIIIIATLSSSYIVKQDFEIKQNQQSDKNYQVVIDSLILTDTVRHRLIPIALYYPKIENLKAKQKVVILSHGYGGNKGGDNVAYNYLTKFLASKGFYVISIQHELPTDELMDLKGKPQEVRKPNWEKGVKNILYTISEFKKKKSNLDFDHLTLIGHSNGGDIVMLFAAEHPTIAYKIISLDNRRMPFPRVKSPKLYSLRSSDQVADEGVLPTEEEQKKFNIKIIKLNNTMDISLKQTPQDHTIQTPHFQLPFLVKSKSVFSIIRLS